MPQSTLPHWPARGLHILLLGEDEAVRRSLHLMLRAHGFEVSSYAAATPLLMDSATAIASLLVVDHHLVDSNGIRVLLALREIGWQGRAIMITASPSPGLRQAALTTGFHTVLEKPLRPQELIRAITAASSPNNPENR
jgi:FixJ family two-component response regulator